jgi:hypothetical protein
VTVRQLRRSRSTKRHLRARAAAGLLLHQTGCNWSDDRVELSSSYRALAKHPDVAHEKVGGPAGVLVAVLVDDPAEAGSGARGERERANKARFDPGITGDIPMENAREHRELRIEARMMTARPAAVGWSAASHTKHLADRRVLCQHHPLATTGRPELRRRLRHRASRSVHQQGETAQQKYRCREAHRPEHDTIVTRLRLAENGPITVPVMIGIVIGAPRGPARPAARLADLSFSPRRQGGAGGAAAFSPAYGWPAGVHIARPRNQ